MERRALILLVGAVAGVPALVVLGHLVSAQLGLHGDLGWHVAIVVAAIVVAGATFYWGRRMLGRQERLRSVAALAEAQYQMVAENSSDAVIHVRGSELVWASPAAETTFGWSREQLVGMDIVSAIHPDDLEVGFAAIEQISDGKSPVIRFRLATAEGAYRWIQGSGKVFLDARGDPDGMVLAAHVIDEQVRAEQQLSAERLRLEAMVKNSPSAISVVDSQHRYTMVNDSFCRLFGQRSVTDVVGRTSAEILPSTLVEAAERARPRVLAGHRCLEEEEVPGGSEDVLVMTQRFGLPDPAGAITEVVTIRTDITHQQKALQQIADRSMWEKRIGAPGGDERLLLVYAQPVVDIATGAEVEEELLLRLYDPDVDEIVQPGHFLPHCERHKLMPVIDRYMTAKAIELARGGRHVSLNINSQTIGDTASMETISQALADAGPKVTEKLTLEITETTALASPAVAKQFSQRMRDLGCRIALDDFGTGYGTFTELRHIHPHILKIDRSFVANMVDDPDDERVVTAIISIAKTYGIYTVAEGIESPAALEKLAALGADRAQGYFLGKPKPVDSTSVAELGGSGVAQVDFRDPS